MSRLSHTFPLRVVEWLLALSMTTWGVLLAMDPHALQDAFFQPMLAVGSAGAWTIFCLGIGLLRLKALAVNGAWRPTPHLRAVTSILSAFLWTQLAWGVVAYGAPIAVAAIYPLLLIAELQVVYRASAEARAADDRARRIRAVSA